MKNFFLLILLSTVISSFAQTHEKISCVIMIDGNLPLYYLNGSIFWNECCDEKSVRFHYTPGAIHIHKDDIKLIDTLPKDKPLSIRIVYGERTDKKTVIWLGVYEEKGFVTAGMIRQRSPYIFSITNFNKRKEIYYFDVKTSYGIKYPRLTSKYGNLKKAYKKIRGVKKISGKKVK